MKLKSLRPNCLEWTLGILLGSWILLVFLHHNLFDYSPNISGPSQVGWLQGQAKNIQGQSFTSNELETTISHLAFLKTEVNEYKPHVHYTSPTNWVIRLSPEKRRTFARGFSWPYRLLVFEYQRIDFPDIEITSKEKEAQPAH